MSFTPGAGTRFLVSTGASGTTPLSGPLSITGGTATANAPVLNATQTWNNAAVTFTGWQLNVTDTASAAASLLMDLQVGGVSQFAVRKSGFVTVNSLNFNSAVPTSFFQAYSNGWEWQSNGNSDIGYVNNVLYLRSTNSFAWGTVQAGGDLFITRDAANTLAQRNGVNAQTLRVYNTFTDASNYERGIFSWSANALSIGTQAAGTGTLRELQLRAQDIFFNAGNAFRWYISSAGMFLPYVDNSFDVGSGGNRIRNLFVASYQEMSEMTAPAAPAANSVRIYAEDNGSGKTRLMARFATGAAQQIAIEP